MKEKYKKAISILENMQLARYDEQFINLSKHMVMSGDASLIDEQTKHIKSPSKYQNPYTYINLYKSLYFLTPCFEAIFGYSFEPPIIGTLNMFEFSKTILSSKDVADIILFSEGVSHLVSGISIIIAKALNYDKDYRYLPNITNPIIAIENNIEKTSRNIFSKGLDKDFFVLVSTFALTNKYVYILDEDPSEIEEYVSEHILTNALDFLLAHELGHCIYHSVISHDSSKFNQIMEYFSEIRQNLESDVILELQWYEELQADDLAFVLATLSAKVFHYAREPFDIYGILSILHTLKYIEPNIARIEAPYMQKKPHPSIFLREKILKNKMLLQNPRSTRDIKLFDQIFSLLSYRLSDKINKLTTIYSKELQNQLDLNNLVELQYFLRSIE